MDDEVKRLQEVFRQLEAEAAERLCHLRDPDLNRVTEDGRSLRQVIDDLSDHYREHVEQLLWTKWGQHIPRSESKRVLAELQGRRAQFAAYITDLQSEQLDVASAVAQNASPREVIRHVMEEERKSFDLIRQALGT